MKTLKEFRAIYLRELQSEVDSGNPDYKYMRDMVAMQPNFIENVVDKMIAAFLKIPCSANIDSPVIRRLCKLAGVKHTYKAFIPFIQALPKE